MLTFSDSTRLAKFFGDFGGNEDMSDFEYSRHNPDIDGIVATIESDSFEKTFREVLPLVCGEFSIKEFSLSGGRKIYAAPALGKLYAMAARLAYAKCTGKKLVTFGSKDRELIGIAVKACAACSMPIKVILGQALSLEEGYAASLEAMGAQVDAKTSLSLFDNPSAYMDGPFTKDGPEYQLQIEANHGQWPRPALTGVFAGLYGADLLEKLGRPPEACVVPIKTGTEALGVFKTLKHTGCKMATCEGIVAQEYHIYDFNCYTLSTRSGESEEPNTSLCPELVDMWRKNKVLRLGCDRLLAVDISKLEETGLAAASLRAAALAFEAMDCKELLVLEV